MNTRFLLVPLLVCLASLVSAQFVTLEGRDFKLDGEDFYPIVMNYHVLYVRNDNVGEPVPANQIYVAPESSFGPTVSFDCTGEPDCLARLLVDFQKVKEMGFNTMRIVGSVVPQYFDTPLLGADERRFQLHLSQNPFPGIDHDANRTYAQLEETVDGDYAQRHFQQLIAVLDMAEMADLKVILLTGGPTKDWNLSQPRRFMYQTVDETAVSDYAYYLGKLAYALKDHPALFAYDLFNEPHYNSMQYNGCFDPTPPSQGGDGCNERPKWKKENICNFTSLWYNAIKDMDPNHLVTLGGLGGEELEQWDPAVMHLDFYSLHIYPTPDYRKNWDIDEATLRYQDHLYWFGQTCPMPWIIGETGFSANDRMDAQYLPHVGVEPEYHVYPYVEGTEAEQRDFVAMSLDKTRSNGGSGWSWWYFQEMRWWEVYYGNSTYLLHEEMRSIYYALLHLGDQNADYYDKLAVQTIRDYDPSIIPPPAEPPNYTNWNSLPGPVSYTGTVKDQFGNPFKEAQAWLRNWSAPIFGTGVNGYESFHPAATNNLGRFDFASEPAGTDHQSPYRQNLIIVATGTNDLAYGLWFGTPVPPTSTNYPLVQNLFQFDELVVGEVLSSIPPSAMTIFEGWNELVVRNVTVEASPTPLLFEFVARNSITVENEFHAQVGSELHIYTDETFPDCNDQSFSLMVPNNDAIGSNGVEKKNDRPTKMELQFGVPDDLLVNVFPNPFTDQFHVVLSSDLQTLLECHDVTGKSIMTKSVNGSVVLDLHELAPGPYAFGVIQGNKKKTFVIIKQPAP